MKVSLHPLTYLSLMYFSLCLFVDLSEESDKFKLYSDAERQRAVRTLRAMKQQLVHERSLKLEAFHQVEDMLQQVKGHNR